VEVKYPCTPDPPNGYHTVQISCRTYGFVHLHMLNSCWIVFFSPLYVFMQPSGSALKEGDNVMAQLLVMCPGPGNTCIIYSQLATSLRSLAIILPQLPSYYSTIMSSTFATVSTDIPSYDTIHRHMSLQ